MMRAQANLPALAVALLILTAVAGISLTIADGAYESAERDAVERHAAVTLSERLVAADASVTRRANVLDQSELDEFDADALVDEHPVVEDHAVRVRLDGEAIVEVGDATGGTTIRRIVLVEGRESVTAEPMLTTAPHVTTVPRRTSSVTLDLDPPAATDVTTVRANDRVVLRNQSGLQGTFTVQLSQYETTQFAFDADGPLPPGSVTLTYYPGASTKAVLEVTVRA